jgi:hypothetical protein
MIYATRWFCPESRSFDQNGEGPHRVGGAGLGSFCASPVRVRKFNFPEGILSETPTEIGAASSRAVSGGVLVVDETSVVGVPAGNVRAVQLLLGPQSWEVRSAIAGLKWITPSASRSRSSYRR